MVIIKNLVINMEMEITIKMKMFQKGFYQKYLMTIYTKMMMMIMWIVIVNG